MNWRIPVAIAWTLLIVVLCSIPGQSLPASPIVSADKLVHFILFAALGWFWVDALRSRKLRAPVAWVLVGGLFLAGLTEVYQGLLPFDRHPNLYDVLANSLGLLMGVWAFHFFRPRRANSAA